MVFLKLAQMGVRQALATLGLQTESMVGFVGIAGRRHRRVETQKSYILEDRLVARMRVIP